MGVDRDFIYNLKEACLIAKKYDVKFYFCLMDTWGITAEEQTRERYLKIAKEIITDQKEALIDAAHQIFHVPEIKERTWAIDVLNEPEGLEQNEYDERRKYTKIDWNDLMNYVMFALSSLKQKTGLPISCGFKESQGMLKAKNRIQDLVDFFDFHKYDDAGDIPRYDSLGITKPCIIGECGQKTKKWDNGYQVTAVKNFLENSKQLGYAGCFLWEYGFKDLNKNDKEMSWCLINPDESHRPVVNVIKKFLE